MHPAHDAVYPHLVAHVFVLESHHDWQGAGGDCGGVDGEIGGGDDNGGDDGGGDGGVKQALHPAHDAA